MLGKTLLLAVEGGENLAGWWMVDDGWGSSRFDLCLVAEDIEMKMSG